MKSTQLTAIYSTRVQYLRDVAAANKRARMLAPTPRTLEQANFAKRPFNEKQLALQLAQFASDNQDLNLGFDQVENLVGALIVSPFTLPLTRASRPMTSVTVLILLSQAEAPSEVVDEMMAAEDVEKSKSASSAIPPSPPSSEQPEQLSTEQRKELQLLQELIRRKLENSKT